MFSFNPVSLASIPVTLAYVTRAREERRAVLLGAAIGSVSFGLALLPACAVGRSLPVITGAWSMGWIESLQLLSRHQKVFEIMAGVALILTGLYCSIHI